MGNCTTKPQRKIEEKKKEEVNKQEVVKVIEQYKDLTQKEIDNTQTQKQKGLTFFPDLGITSSSQQTQDRQSNQENEEKRNQNQKKIPFEQKEIDKYDGDLLTNEGEGEEDLLLLLLQVLQNPKCNIENYNENEGSIQKQKDEINKLTSSNFIKVEAHKVQQNSIIATFTGKLGTFHEGAKYMLEILIHEEHPVVKPLIMFRGVVPYHCNVNAKGMVSIQYLDQWKQNSSIKELLSDINYLIYKPNIENSISVNFINTEEGQDKCRIQAKKSKSNTLDQICLN